MSTRLLSTLSLPPSTLSALAGAGYETISDLSNSTPEQLSKDLNIPLPASQAVFSATRAPTAFPMTQSAAAMMGTTKRYSTACPPLDRLLGGGGLKRGSVLELNGPPGCGKEQIAARAVKGFVNAKQEVLFVDMQNMIPPATIKRILSAANGPMAPADGLDLVHYLTLHTSTEFVVFVRNLPAYLKAHPETGLLVLNSLVFPLQSDMKECFALLELLKPTLALLCASMNLTVIITSHLASQEVTATAPGAKEPQRRWIMIPFIKDHKNFPSGRTYRVLIVPQWKTSGVMRLLYSPTHVPHQPVPEEPYEKIGGVIQ